MSLKIDISLCRVCCKSEATHSIFKYARKFHYCTSILVAENDGLPTKICELCLERLKVAVEFKKKSEFSDRQLKSFIANVNNQFMALEGSGNDDDSDDEDGEEGQEEREAKAPKEEFVTPQNSALGFTKETVEQKQVQEESSPPEREIEEVELSPEPESEPESEPEQEQEKFRAVAVIQEKPTIKPKKDAFDMVEVDYGDNILHQEEMEVEEQEPDQQNPLMSGSETGEEQEQVIYIGFTTHYQEEEDEDEQNPDIDETSEKRDEFSDTSEVDHSYRQQKYPTETRLDLSASSTKSSLEGKSSGKFECVECAKSFSTKTNLNRHLQTHNGNKPYVCPLCQKGFTQSGSLKQHLLIHQNIRPYVCSVCGQGFTQQKSLTFHMRRHTNEKPFVCPHCSYAFRQKDGLKRHLLLRHTAKDAKSFRCDVCEQTFQTRYALSMHRKRLEAGVINCCRRKESEDGGMTVSVEIESEEGERAEMVEMDEK